MKWYKIIILAILYIIKTEEYEKWRIGETQEQHKARLNYRNSTIKLLEEAYKDEN